MFRNAVSGSSPLGISSGLIALRRVLFASVMALCVVALSAGRPLFAQSTSGGGVKGLITDPQGAVVRDATVTATNTDTGVQTTTKSNGSGQYVLQPLQVGNYNIEVVAKGFQRYLQENITVDNATILGLPFKLIVGGEDTTVTVTDAPPFLNTTDASLGGTIENELYSELPLSMNGGPRDPTAFQYLMPGVQENPANNNGTGANNGNSGIYGGTGQTNLNENYVEGVPVSNISQQGSNTSIASAVSVDAVDQFSVTTSGAGVQFGGAGTSNYTIKSGGNQFHGSAVDYIRNTMFDTWGYFAKVPNAAGIAEKPGEHQNQYDISVGGPILKDKLFFFADYSGFHYTKISNTPQYLTVPSCAERGQQAPSSKDPLHCGAYFSDHGGDFTDKLGSVTPALFNPLVGSFGGARKAFTGLLNGIPTNNVINLQYMSPISEYLQNALPAPSSNSTIQNYLASLPLANTDYSVDARIDYTLNSRNKFSVVVLGGNVGYGQLPFYSNYNQLPIPYSAGKYTNQKTATGIISYVFIASQRVINTLKYGYTRSWGQGFSLTQGTKWNASAAGINNLPIGGGTSNMPIVNFKNSTAGNALFTTSQTATTGTWASNASTGPLGVNSYSLIDNLTWVKGRHNFTFGAQLQWLQSNAGSFGGYSPSITLGFDSNATTQCTSGSGSCLPNGVPNGDVYAAYLIGAVFNDSVTNQSIQDVGGRFHPIASYIQDAWQVTPRLTLNLGIRYDYLQPYHEAKNRMAFLNPTITNPLVNLPGVLMYGGSPDASTPSAYAPYYCHCRTPVHPYNKNIEPNIGFSFAVTPSTVIAGSYSVHYTHAGGSGGGTGVDSSGNPTLGTGANTSTSVSSNSGVYQLTTSYSQSASTGDPEFDLNPASPPTTGVTVFSPPNGGGTNLCLGTQPVNTTTQGCNAQIPCVAAGTCSPYSAIPPWVPSGANISPLQNTGNYNFINTFADHANDLQCPTSDQQHCNTGKQNYFDPYYGGRGPQFITYNFSIQHMINKKAVLTVAYAGSQTHFLPGGSGRGYATNVISPDYSIQYGGLLGSIGYAGQSTGAAPPIPGWGGSTALFSASLRPFPQYGSFNDEWPDTGNAAYNALQISVVQRPWHNLSGLINYTRSKTLDDAGNHRTQFPVGPQDGNFPHALGANQVDRSLSQNNQTNAFNVTWVYSLPFGRGQAFFATNRLGGLIGGGWQFSGIYRYRDGSPLQITNGQSCLTNQYGLQGTCFPDATPGFDRRRARINGRWGRGPGANASNVSSIAYIDAQAFDCPDSNLQNITLTCGVGNSAAGGTNTTSKLGNVARTAPYGLTGPGWWEVQLGIRRTFNIRETARMHLTFQFEADVDNATNSTFFNIASTSWNGNTPTTTTTSSFGQVSGQNKSIQPRDWQFAGRLRF